MGASESGPGDTGDIEEEDEVTLGREEVVVSRNFSLKFGTRRNNASTVIQFWYRDPPVLVEEAKAEEGAVEGVIEVLPTVARLSTEGIRSYALRVATAMAGGRGMGFIVCFR